MEKQHVNIPEENLQWRRVSHDFSSILGQSSVTAWVLDYDGPTILKPGECERLGRLQARRYLRLLLCGEAQLSYDEFYYLLRLFKTDSAKLARMMNCAKTTFSNFKSTGKVDKRVEREIALCFALELAQPGTISHMSSEEHLDWLLEEMPTPHTQEAKTA